MQTHQTAVLTTTEQTFPEVGHMISTQIRLTKITDGCVNRSTRKLYGLLFEENWDEILDLLLLFCPRKFTHISQSSDKPWHGVSAIVCGRDRMGLVLQIIGYLIELFTFCLFDFVKRKPKMLLILISARQKPKGIVIWLTLYLIFFLKKDFSKNFFISD